MAAAMYAHRPLRPKALFHSCPSCGQHADGGDDQAQKRILELEAEVALFAGKVSTLVDRINDYEDEISKLHKSTNAANVTAAAAAAAAKIQPSPERPVTPAPVTTALSTTASKFSYFLRKPTSPAAIEPASVSPTTSTTTIPITTHATQTSTSLPPPNTIAEDLQRALDQEKVRRQAAESQVTKISGELDELSAVLFQQANEMVAAERKARDRLEKRVAELEQRDKEKMVRLTNIEKAVDRINRVRGLLAPGNLLERERERG